jgi:hypothetical protein
VKGSFELQAASFKLKQDAGVPALGDHPFLEA